MPFLLATLYPVKCGLMSADIVTKPVSCETFLTHSGHCNDVRRDRAFWDKVIIPKEKQFTKGIGRNSKVFSVE